MICSDCGKEIPKNYVGTRTIVKDGEIIRKPYCEKCFRKAEAKEKEEIVERGKKVTEIINKELSQLGKEINEIMTL